MGHFICFVRCQQSTTNRQTAFAPTALSPTQRCHRDTADVAVASAGKLADIAN